MNRHTNQRQKNRQSTSTQLSTPFTLFMALLLLLTPVYALENATGNATAEDTTEDIIIDPIEDQPALSCETLGTTMNINPDGTGFIGCDVKITGDFDLENSYCESEITRQKENLVPDTYGKENQYFATLEGLSPYEKIYVYVADIDGSIIECAPALNEGNERPKELVAHYTGSQVIRNIVRDQAKNHDGTLQNGATTTQTNGKTVFQFDGKDDLIEVPDAQDLHMYEELTLAAWVKPSNTAKTHTILNKWYAMDSYSLSVSGHEWTFTLSFPDEGWGESYDLKAPVLETNEWTHLAGVYDGNVMKLYINGEKVAQQEVQRLNKGKKLLQQSQRPIAIGNHPSWNGYEGLIDDVRIYNYALSRVAIEDIVDEDCYDCPPICIPQEEICDGADNDCDGVIDEGCTGRVCLTTDGGYNPGIKGETTSCPIDPNTGLCLRHEEVCLTQNQLQESYCGVNQNIVKEIITCDGLCINGACVEDDTEQICTDTDGGIVPEEKGTVETCATQPDGTVVCESTEDSCRTERHLNEYYCEDDTAKVRNIPCQGLCVDGTCAEELGDHLLHEGNFEVYSLGDFDYRVELSYVSDQTSATEARFTFEGKDTRLLKAGQQAVVHFADKPKLTITAVSVDAGNFVGGKRIGFVTFNLEQGPVTGGSDTIRPVEPVPPNVVPANNDLSESAYSKLVATREVQQTAQTQELLCSSGCELNDRCVPFGMRTKNGEAKYCSLEGEFQLQKPETASCQNNYECATNMCLNGACVDLPSTNLEEKSFIRRLLLWVESVL